jgi:CHAD domain-containing protein
VLESSKAATKLYPFPQPTGTTGIQPLDPLSEAARKVMTFHFAQMLRFEEGTRRGEDIEDLHRMRVATRRMRAAFEVFAEAFEPGALKPYLKGLRATGRALGAVRDLDVFMEKAHIYLQTLPEEAQGGLDPLLAAWEHQRQSSRAQMLAFLDSQDYYAFKRKFNVFLHTPGAGARKTPKDQPTPTTVRDLAPVLIYSRLANVRAYGPYLEDATIELLHALRIEFKKLRYTVEYFREVLGPKAESVIEELKNIQDHLGDLNDAQVATVLLRQFIDEQEARQSTVPIHDRPDLQAVVNYMAARHAERHRLMLSFQETWKSFNRRAFRRSLAQAIST